MRIFHSHLIFLFSGSFVSSLFIFPCVAVCCFSFVVFCDFFFLSILFFSVICLSLGFCVCGYHQVYTKVSFIYTVVHSLLNTSYFHSPLQSQAFTPSLLCFCCHRLSPLMLLVHFQIAVALVFSVFLMFLLHLTFIFECIICNSEKGLQYFASVFLLVILLIVLYPFVFCFRQNNPLQYFL